MSSDMLELSVNGLDQHDSKDQPSNFSPNLSRFHVARVTNEFSDVDTRRVSITAPTSKKVSVDYSSSYYDTRNIKSFLYYTREALPRLDHYRHVASVHGHISRPSLDELHGNHSDDLDAEPKVYANGEVISEPQVKFGWVVGVFIRCLAGIWGIMLFLRLSWMVAHAGLGYSVVIILLSSTVTMITVLSTSAICTNGEVRGGGTYYMISRSLGPEFGASIGIIFSIANTVAVAMYTVGFAETVNNLLKMNNMQIMEDDIDNIRIIGLVAVLAYLVIVMVGTSWEAKAQVFMIIILVASIFDFMVGSFFPPNEYEKKRGFVGWQWSVLGENLGPQFRDGENFFSLLSVYFPAVTGILAGANISGDLKDPGRAIPLGTILAIVITTISYLALAVTFSSSALREVVVNGTVVEINGMKQGLYHNYNIVGLLALYEPLIYAGIFCASLSSALGSFVSAPKVFQALCKDKIFPCIEFFGKGSKRNNEPYRGYVLTFAIAVCCTLVGDLNSIAPIISNFFLAAYCLINFSCFHASFSKTLGFRPSFKYYNMWVSLIGATICMALMFVIDWQAALVTFVIEFVLYCVVVYRKPDVNWGSSTRAQIYRSALHSAHKLNYLPEHVKTYRPQILLLSGSTTARPALVDFAYEIVKGFGMLTCGHIVDAKVSRKLRDSITQKNYDWFRTREIKAFYTLMNEESFFSGAKNLIRASGIGKLRPNVVFLGYKSDWQTSDAVSLLDYFNVIHEALDQHMGVCILRFRKGFDYSRYGSLTKIFESMEEKNHHAFFNLTFNSNHVTKSLQEPLGQSVDEIETPITASCDCNCNQLADHPQIIVNPVEVADISIDKVATKEVSAEALFDVDTFRRKQKKSTIDVWWLYDDGGLTMLIPYILSHRKQWHGCKLRIFALANKKDDLNREQRNMVALLTKFRIDHSDVIVIPNIVKPPKEENQRVFNNLIEKWRRKEVDKESAESTSGPESQIYISDSEFYTLKNKSNRHVRLRELLEEYSMNASLIDITDAAFGCLFSNDVYGLVGNINTGYATFFVDQRCPAERFNVLFVKSTPIASDSIGDLL